MSFALRTGFQDPSNVAARMNIAPPPPPAQTLVSLRLGGWASSVSTSAGIAPPTSSATGAQGPAPGSSGQGGAAPPSVSAAAASLSPTIRMGLKIGTVIAAVFFFNKGDYVLGGVSAAAAAGAFIYL